MNEGPSAPHGKFPAGAVLAAGLLGISGLILILGTRGPATDDRTPNTAKADGKTVTAQDQTRKVTKSKWGAAAKSWPHPAPLESNYTPPKGDAWSRSELEHSPELWAKKFSGKLPLNARAEVLTYFRHTTNLPVRITVVTELLRQLPDEEVSQAIAFAVTNDYRQLTVSSDDASLINDLFTTLTLTTSNSEFAFAFALQGVEFEFWETNRPFFRALDDDGMTDQWALTSFSSAAITAIGLASRPEVPAILTELSKRDIDYTYYVASALVDAAYHQEFLIRRQEPNFRLIGGNELQDFSNWRRNTASGKQWSDWADAVGKQRPKIKRN